MDLCFMSGKNASNILGVHGRTLYNWEIAGKIEAIRTPGGKRLYNVRKFISDNMIYSKYIDKFNDDKIKICYCRVSSAAQFDDLERQINFMKKNYPLHQIIKDIGSGMNMKRSGLKKIINLSIQGKVSEVIVTYKDRLARFGYDLIEYIINKYSDGKIIIINGPINDNTYTEIVEDILQIMNVYVAKINGMRRWKHKH